MAPKFDLDTEDFIPRQHRHAEGGQNTIALRRAFGAFPTGVTIVTTCDAIQNPVGFTANSFASVSLDPPLLLVCIARRSYNLQTMTSARGFAINILSKSQTPISDRFAHRCEERFATVKWMLGPNGSPILGGVAAWFDCEMERIVDGGDHAIMIGRVKAFADSALEGLGFARGAYF